MSVRIRLRLALLSFAGLVRRSAQREGGSRHFGDADLAGGPGLQHRRLLSRRHGEIIHLVGAALKCCPAAAPETVTVIEPPVIAVPLMAVAMVASAVLIVPCVTQPTLRTRPRNGARI